MSGFSTVRRDLPPRSPALSDDVGQTGGRHGFWDQAVFRRALQRAPQAPHGMGLVVVVYVHRQLSPLVKCARRDLSRCRAGCFERLRGSPPSMQTRARGPGGPNLFGPCGAIATSGGEGFQVIKGPAGGLFALSL